MSHKKSQKMIVTETDGTKMPMREFCEKRGIPYATGRGRFVRGERDPDKLGKKVITVYVTIKGKEYPSTVAAKMLKIKNSSVVWRQRQVERGKMTQAELETVGVLPKFSKSKTEMVRRKARTDDEQASNLARIKIGSYERKMMGI